MCRWFRTRAPASRPTATALRSSSTIRWCSLMASVWRPPIQVRSFPSATTPSRRTARTARRRPKLHYSKRDLTGADASSAVRSGRARDRPGLVRPQRRDLILYPEFLPFELVDSYVIARRVLKFLGDGRFETLVTFTQLSNACFQAHQVSPVLRAGGALTGKEFPDF